MIRAAGYEPTVVEYLKAGWTKKRLKELLRAMAAKPRDILREKDTPAAELGLLNRQPKGFAKEGGGTGEKAR